MSAAAFSAACVLAAVSAWIWSPTWVVGHVALSVVGGLVVLYTYCARCPCRTHCGHWLPGRVAAVLFPGREPGPYTAWETGAMAASVAVIALGPQAWLWRTPVLLGAFWVLAGVAVVQIRLKVCPGCDNGFCPARVRPR